MKITKDSIGKMALDEFITAVAGIYDRKDKARSIWDIWLHTVHHAASIGEEARKYKPGRNLYKEIADFSMWLFTFAGKIRSPMGVRARRETVEASTIRTEVAFSDLIWNKYPRVCPVCFGRRADESIDVSDTRLTEPCDCLLYSVETRDPEPERTRSHIDKLRLYATTQREADKPKSVDAWQEMFQKIFEANLRHLSLTSIAFHLLEEVGEVSDAMVRMYTYTEPMFQAGEVTWHKIGLENEIADVCSWLFTLVNHLQVIPDIVKEYEIFLYGEEVSKKEEIKLSRIIWGRYGNDQLESFYCPHCKAPEKCACPIVVICDNNKLAKLKSYTTDIPT